MSGAVPPPAARPLKRAAGVPRPVCPGCGRCGCGDPAPAPRRAPLRAGVARRGGGGRASPGGLPSAVVRGVWCQTLPLPWLPALWARCWGSSGVCGVCGVCAVRFAVPLFSCPYGAPPSGVSVRCCARRVPAVPPSLCAPLARLLANPCSFRGFVALYPFLYPSPWHALFPCLRFGACLGLFPCRLVVLSRWAFFFEAAKRKDVNGRAAAGVLSRYGILSVPSSVGLLLTRRCGMLPVYASFVCFFPLFSYRVVLVKASFIVRRLALVYILLAVDMAPHTSLAATFVCCPSRVRGVTCNILARKTNFDQSCFLFQQS